MADSMIDAILCPERWNDEIGCDRPGDHACDKPDGHRDRRHKCECGAMCIEDPS